MSTMTLLLLSGFVLMLWQRRTLPATRYRRWRPRQVWLSPPRCGDAAIDARNAADRSKWTCVVVNRGL